MVLANGIDSNSALVRRRHRTSIVCSCHIFTHQHVACVRVAAALLRAVNEMCVSGRSPRCVCYVMCACLHLIDAKHIFHIHCGCLRGPRKAGKDDVLRCVLLAHITLCCLALCRLLLLESTPQLLFPSAHLPRMHITVLPSLCRHIDTTTTTSVGRSIYGKLMLITSRRIRTQQQGHAQTDTRIIYSTHIPTQNTEQQQSTLCCSCLSVCGAMD